MNGVPAAAARRTANFRLAGVIIGLVAGSTAAGSGALGRGLLLTGPVFGLCVLAGVVAGEISMRPTRGQTRTAVVEVRGGCATTRRGPDGLVRRDPAGPGQRGHRLAVGPMTARC